MQIIKIEVSDSIYEHILFFLKNLPKNLVKISYDNTAEEKNDKNLKEEITELFSSQNIEAFTNIQDPLTWQKNIRDEWE